MVIFTVVLGTIGFSFIVPRLAKSLDPKPRQYIGLVGDYNLGALPAEIEHLVSLGLTSIEEDGTPVPELSERWTTEDNGKSYRFVLKKNLVWQDGKPLETSDIKYPFSDVETVTTANDVIFNLPEPFVPFPTVVSRPIFRTGTTRSLFFFTRPVLIGLGEYQITDFKQNGVRLTEMTIESQSERRIYRFYLSENDAVIGFKRGEVDILPDLNATADIGTWPTTQTDSQLDQSSYLAVFFNLENPMFSKNTRQALAYAIVKPTDDTRAYGPIPPTSWAYLEGGKGYEYDLTRGVERLLAELPGEPLRIELTTTPLYEQDANLIKRDWEELGRAAERACQTDARVTNKTECQKATIGVTIRITSFPDTTNFQALLIGQEAPTDPDQYPLWHSDQSSNFARYRNTRIDSLLEKGRQIADRSERLAIYQEFQQFFLEDTPAIFLRHLTSYTITRK
jgi:peptide/nickel transport system substrate-binding protein